MPQGTVIRGEDGIILLKDTSGNVIGEVPCLKSFSIETGTSLNSRSTKCMRSNGDGGSGASSIWETSVIEGRNWSASLEFYWQQDDNIPAAVQLDPTNSGDVLSCEFFLNDNLAGRKVYAGKAFIETVSISTEVSGDIMCSVSLKGDGEFEKASVA